MKKLKFLFTSIAIGIVLGSLTIYTINFFYNKIFFTEEIESTQQLHKDSFTRARARKLLSLLSEDIVYSQKYIDRLEKYDLTWWYKITYVSNTTGNHNLESGTTPMLSTIDYSRWDNNTNNPVFYIPAKHIPPNSTYYYRIKIVNSTSGYILYSSSIEKFKTILRVKQHILKELFITGISPNATNTYWDYSAHINESLNKIFYDSYRNRWVRFEETRNDDGLQIWISYGDIWGPWSLNTTIDEIPSKWDVLKSNACMILPNGSYYLYRGIKRSNGTGMCYYTGNDWNNLILQGIAMKYGENKNLTVNARFKSVWYNETDKKFYCFLGGSNISRGGWQYVYLCESTDGNFTGDSDTKYLYFHRDWLNCSWTNSFVYPPNIDNWWDEYGRTFSITQGCSHSRPPYDFDMDIIFFDRGGPRSVSASTYYTPISSHDAYGNSHSLWNFSNVAGSKLFREENGTIWGMTSEYPGLNFTGTLYRAGDIWLLQFTGFWANETIEIEPGYNPAFHYNHAPSKSQFKSIYNLTVRVWSHEAKITINQISGTAPIYAKFIVDGISGDQIYIHIKDLTNRTCYLHRDNSNGNDVFTITNDPNGAIKVLYPTGIGGDDLLFSLKLTGKESKPYSIE